MEVKLEKTIGKYHIRKKWTGKKGIETPPSVRDACGRPKWA
jgi:hypothetical protein